MSTWLDTYREHHNMSATYRIVCLLIVSLAISVLATEQSAARTAAQINAQTNAQISTHNSALARAIDNNLNNPQLVGEARLKFAFWKVFDAALYSETGRYDSKAPFALELTYLRALKSEKIVDKSMQEIRRLTSSSITAGQLKVWRQRLSDMIPDVSKGMSITGIRTPEGYTEIYVGDTRKGSIDDTNFTDAFFAIWLGEDTAEPEFRAKLTGLDRSS